MSPERSGKPPQRKKRPASQEPGDAPPSPTKKAEEAPSPTSAKKAPKKQQAIARKLELTRKLSRQSEDAAALAKVNTDFGAYVSALLQESDQTLHKARRTKDLLAGLKLLRKIVPVKPQRQERTLQASLLLSPMPGREMYFAKVAATKENNSWALNIAAKGQTSFMSKRTVTFTVRYSAVPGSNLDRVKEIGWPVADIRKAWPWPTAPSGNHVRRFIVDLPVERRIGHQKPQIRDSLVHGDHRHSIVLTHFDPYTGETRQKVITIRPSDEVARELIVPDVPDITLLPGPLDEAGNAANGRLPKNSYLGAPPKLKDTSAKSQRLAQDAIRFLFLRCDDVVMRKRWQGLSDRERGRWGSWILLEIKYCLATLRDAAVVFLSHRRTACEISAT